MPTKRELEDKVHALQEENGRLYREAYWAELIIRAAAVLDQPMSTMAREVRTKEISAAIKAFWLGIKPQPKCVLSSLPDWPEWTSMVQVEGGEWQLFTEWWEKEIRSLADWEETDGDQVGEGILGCSTEGMGAAAGSSGEPAGDTAG